MRVVVVHVRGVGLLVFVEVPVLVVTNLTLNSRFLNTRLAPLGNGASESYGQAWRNVFINALGYGPMGERMPQTPTRTGFGARESAACGPPYEKISKPSRPRGEDDRAPTEPANTAGRVVVQGPRGCPPPPPPARGDDELQDSTTTPSHINIDELSARCPLPPPRRVAVVQKSAALPGWTTTRTGASSSQPRTGRAAVPLPRASEEDTESGESSTDSSDSEPVDDPRTMRRTLKMGRRAIVLGDSTSFPLHGGSTGLMQLGGVSSGLRRPKLLSGGASSGASCSSTRLLPPKAPLRGTRTYVVANTAMEAPAPRPGAGQKSREGQAPSCPTGRQAMIARGPPPTGTPSLQSSYASPPLGGLAYEDCRDAPPAQRGGATTPPVAPSIDPASDVVDVLSRSAPSGRASTVRHAASADFLSGGGGINDRRSGGEDRGSIPPPSGAVPGEDTSPSHRNFRRTRRKTVIRAQRVNPSLRSPAPSFIDLTDTEINDSALESEMGHPTDTEALERSEMGPGDRLQEVRKKIRPPGADHADVVDQVCCNKVKRLSWSGSMNHGGRREEGGRRGEVRRGGGEGGRWGGGGKEEVGWRRGTMEGGEVCHESWSRSP